MTLPIIYHVRNLAVRKLSTVLTFVVVAAVVFVLAVLLSFASGIQASLKSSGHDRNILALARGATAESTSIILFDEAVRLSQTPGVAKDGSGELIISREVHVQTSIPRKDALGSPANVAVRGVDDIAFLAHQDVRVMDGRPFEQGQLELIVGKAAQERYRNLSIGDEIQLGRLGNRQFKVVGVFEASGGALESEIWAPRTIIADAFNRQLVSSAVLRLSEGASVEEALAYIKGPTVALDAKTERDYYRELSAKTQEIVVLATILVSIMAVGAVFAVANTMFAAVDGRRREIAMLRTLGFSRGSIMVSFTFESLLICVPACLLGLALSSMISGSRQDYLSDATWTVLAYKLEMSPSTVLMALILSTLVGVAGALAPALRAARTRIIEALRKA